VQETLDAMKNHGILIEIEEYQRVGGLVSTLTKGRGMGT
jgi:hypothetical protein